MGCSNQGPDEETADIRRELVELGRQQQEVRAKLRDLTDDLRTRSLVDPSVESESLYMSALELLGINGLTHPDITTITRLHRLKEIPHADSFWQSIVMRRRKKQLATVPEKFFGVNKDYDERFARGVGLRTPKTIYRGPLSKVPRNVSPAVLKPAVSSDSRGAFYLLEDGLFSIGKSRRLTDWSDLERLARTELGSEFSLGQEWLLQELVTMNGCPAPDIKFYMFYGSIGVILDARRYPTWKYRYFDGEWNPIESRRDLPGAAIALSDSVPERERYASRLEVVRSVPLQIPVPFMRIDFLNGTDELVFCEMSAAPGMSHDLLPAEDRRLGRLYHEAEVRLVNDLRRGKTFSRFCSFCDDLSAGRGN